MKFTVQSLLFVGGLLLGALLTTYLMMDLLTYPRPTNDQWSRVSCYAGKGYKIMNSVVNSVNFVNANGTSETYSFISFYREKNIIDDPSKANDSSKSNYHSILAIIASDGREIFSTEAYGRIERILLLKNYELVNATNSDDVVIIYYDRGERSAVRYDSLYGFQDLGPISVAVSTSAHEQAP